MPGTPSVLAVQWAPDDSWAAVQVASGDASGPQLLVFGVPDCQLWTQIHLGSASVLAWTPQPDSEGLLAVIRAGPGDARLAACSAWSDGEPQHVGGSRLSMWMGLAEKVALTGDASLAVGLLHGLTSSCVIVADARTGRDLRQTVLMHLGPPACGGLHAPGQGADSCLLLGPRCLTVSSAEQPPGSELPGAFCMAVFSLEAHDVGLGLHVVVERAECGQAFSPCGSFLAICNTYKLQVLEARTGHTIAWWPLAEACSPLHARLVACDHPARRLAWARNGQQLCVATSRLDGCRVSRLLAVVQFAA